MRVALLLPPLALACACADAAPPVSAPTTVSIPPAPSATVRPVENGPATSASANDVAPSDVPQAPPAPERVKVTFELLTDGARVTLARDGDVRVLPMFPITVAFDPRQRWTLHATKPGFCEVVIPLDLENGPPVRRVDIELQAGCP